MGQLAYLVSPWFLVIMQAEMFDGMVEGASYLAIGIGLLTITIGVLPAIFLRERFANAYQDGVSLASTKVKDSVKAFLNGFVLTLSVRPFRYLCLATFLVFNGFMLIAAFSSYVIIYYVFSGDTELGAEYAGWAGSVGAVSTFVVIAVVSLLSSRIGKRNTFFVAMWLSVVGYALKWVCYNPDMPWLVIVPAPFMAFGLGALFTLMGSMMADVCDYDELQTGQRREGMFGSIYWWVVKLGMAAALAASGFLLNATGFDVALKGAQTDNAIFLMRLFDVVIPVVATVIAVFAIKRYDLTEARANEIRQTLELRRGTR
jgi:GPH family glycoside/pentoside/hexuronide:cation symporter